MQNFWNLSGGAVVLLLACSIVVLVEGLYLHKVGTSLGGVCVRVAEKWQSEHQSKNEKYTGAVAAVDFKGSIFPEAKNFETAIEKAVHDGPNFAGHYTVAEWGCGTACQNHAIVEARTGTIVAMGIPSDAGVKYSTDSPILISNPRESIPNPHDLEKSSLESLIAWTRLSRDYYAIEEKNDHVSLTFLCTENLFDGVWI